PGRPPRDRHRDGDREQSDGSEDVVARAAHYLTGADAPGWPGRLRRFPPRPQTSGESSPVIRHTETRPECRIWATAGAFFPQPPSGEGLAVAGLLRSRVGVVTR